MVFESTILKMKELEVEPEHSNEESEDDSDDDCDTCNVDEISRIFPSCRHIIEKSVALNKYILHIAGTLESHPYIAIGLSDNSCEVYNLNNEQFAKTATFSEHTDSIIDVKFSSENSNLVYTASSDGTIKLWDLRTPKRSTCQFTDTTVEDINRKTLASFDISPNNKLLTAGTNLIEGDAFLLFWDIRKTTLLGGYWESHTDDITQVKYSAEDPNRLISGSTDGLINLYDLSQNCEDDALIDTFNTESSIEKLSWHNVNEGNVIGCVTHTSEVQLWKLEDAQPFLHFRRPDLAKAMKRKSEGYMYVVDLYDNLDNLFLLAGSNFDDGKCLRAMVINEESLHPILDFPQNKQRVRASWLHPNINLLVTGGEKGTVNAWEAKLVHDGKLPRKRKKL